MKPTLQTKQNRATFLRKPSFDLFYYAQRPIGTRPALQINQNKRFSENRVKKPFVSGETGFMY